MKKFLCLLMMCILTLCASTLVGCTKDNATNDTNSNITTIPQIKTGLIYNGIEYELMSSIATNEYSYEISGNRYTMSLSVLITNHNDVEFVSHKQIFKLTASNNKVSYGEHEGYFGDITIWEYDSSDINTEITVAPKSTKRVNLEFNSGTIKVSDYIRWIESSSGYYTYNNDFLNSCKIFMEETNFNLYLGDKIISKVHFLVYNNDTTI